MKQNSEQMKERENNGERDDELEQESEEKEEKETEQKQQQKEKEKEKRSEDIPLHLLLLSLPTEKGKLFLTLSQLRAATHISQSQWNTVSEKVPNLLDLSFEIVRKYEINGLQLNGLGCWLFEKVITLGKCSLHSSEKYSEEIILEVILRIFFEHPIAITCQEILVEALKQNSKAIFLICQIGLRIVDELPQTISEESYSLLFALIMNFVEKLFLPIPSPVDHIVTTINISQFHLISLCFHLLTVMSVRVSISYRTNYFLEEVCEKIFPIYLNFLQQFPSHQFIFLETLSSSGNEIKEVEIDAFTPLSHECLSNSSLTTGYNILYSFLSALLPLHYSHIHILHKYHYFQSSIDLIKSNLPGIRLHFDVIEKRLKSALSVSEPPVKIPINYAILYSISLIKFLLEMSSVPVHLKILQDQFSVKDFVELFPYYSYLPSDRILPIHFSDHIIFFINFFQLCYGNNLLCSNLKEKESNESKSEMSTEKIIDHIYDQMSLNPQFNQQHRYFSQYHQYLLCHSNLLPERIYPDHQHIFPFIDKFLHYSAQLLTEYYYTYDLPQAKQTSPSQGRPPSWKKKVFQSHHSHQQMLSLSHQPVSNGGPSSPTGHVDISAFHCPISYLFLSYRLIHSSSPMLRAVILFEKQFTEINNKIILLIQKYFNKIQQKYNPTLAHNRNNESMKTVIPKSPHRKSFIDLMGVSALDENNVFNELREDEEEDEDEEKKDANNSFNQERNQIRVAVSVDLEDPQNTVKLPFDIEADVIITDENEDEEDGDNLEECDEGESDTNSSCVFLMDMVSFFSGWDDMIWKWFPPIDSSVEKLFESGLEENNLHTTPILSPSLACQGQPWILDSSMEIKYLMTQLSNFTSTWETESIATVIQQILLLMAISRYYTPLSHSNYLLLIENLHISQLIEIVIELLADSRHGITTILIQEKCIQLLTDCILYANNYENSNHTEGKPLARNTSNNHSHSGSSLVETSALPQDASPVDTEPFVMTGQVNYDYIGQSLEIVFELMFHYAETSHNAIELVQPLNTSELAKYLIKYNNFTEYIYHNFIDTCFHYLYLLLSLYPTHHTFDLVNNVLVDHQVGSYLIKYRKIFVGNLERIHSSIFFRPGSHFQQFQVIFLEISKRLLPSIKRMTITQEIILFQWIIPSLTSDSFPFLLSCCHFFDLLISNGLGYVITRLFSRVEVESHFIRLVKVKEITMKIPIRVLLSIYRILSFLIGNYNPTPYWIPDQHIFPVRFHYSPRTELSRPRELLTKSFLTEMIELYEEVYSSHPCHYLIFSSLLDLFHLNIQCNQTHYGTTSEYEDYIRNYFCMTMPIVSKMLKQLTKDHIFISSNSSHYQRRNQEVAVELISLSQSATSASVSQANSSPSTAGTEKNGSKKKEKKKTKKNQISSYLSGMMSSSETLYHQYIHSSPSSSPSSTIGSSSDCSAPSFATVSPNETLSAASPPRHTEDPASPSTPQSFTLSPSESVTSLDRIILSYQSLLCLELHSITPEYEAITSSLLRYFHLLVHNSLSPPDEFFAYRKAEPHFESTPLPEAIIYLLIQYPHHHLIQTNGLHILNKFIEHSYGLEIIHQCCNKILNNVMVNTTEENSPVIHELFCNFLLNFIQKYDNPVDLTDHHSNSLGNIGNKTPNCSPRARSASEPSGSFGGSSPSTGSGGIGPSHLKRKGSTRNFQESTSLKGSHEDDMKDIHQITHEMRESKVSEAIITDSKDPNSSQSKTTSSDSPTTLKECIMKWGLYKWLYVILKKDSHEIAFKACQLITLLSCNETNANLICDSGLIRIILLLLEKFAHTLTIQYEGLKTILTLCKETNQAIKIIKLLKGEKTLKGTRKYLKSLIVTFHETRTQELLHQNNLSKEEVERIYQESSAKKKIDQCFLS